MTILASTPEHLVEFSCGMLTIARRTDGQCLAMKASGIAGEFRSCVKSHSAERAIATHIRIGERIATWKPLYKAGRVPA